MQNFLSRPLGPLSLGLCAVLLLAGCAHVPKPRPQALAFRPAIKALMRFDSNHDGDLTRGELDAGLRARFAKADTNHDGRLDKAEVRAVNEARWSRRGATASPLVDWNQDGYVDLSEYASAPHSLFDELDVNNDGVLSKAELKPPVAQPRRHKRRGNGLWGGHRRRRGPNGEQGGERPGSDGDGD
jgi:hypothetical protein